jgi:hypothetical protein
MTRAPRGLVVATLMAGVAWGCTEVSTDPAVIAAIGADSLPSTAIVVGDTLRGPTLAPAPVRVRAFSGAGDSIAGAEITAILLDTASDRALTITPGRLVIGRRAIAAGRFVFRAGDVQTGVLQVEVIDSVPVLARADAIADSLFYDAADTTFRIGELRARLTRGASTQAAGGFRVAMTTLRVPAQLDSIAFYGANGRRTDGVTSGTDGLVRVRVRAFARPDARGDDSVVVQARLLARGRDVPGSPLRLVMRVRGVPR